jgi:hypothetical protein
LRDADGTAVALPRQQDSLQADGTFEIPLLPPGNYTVQVRRKVEVRTAGSMRIAWTTLANSIVHATVTAGETTHLSLDAPAQALGTLRGRIVPTSAGLTAAGLALLGTDNAVRGVFPIASDGSFFADDLLPGRYQVVVAKDANMLMNGIPATLAREIEALPGGALREEFVLTPRKLTLRFRSAAGGPIDAPIASPRKTSCSTPRQNCRFRCVTKALQTGPRPSRCLPIAASTQQKSSFQLAERRTCLSAP